MAKKKTFNQILRKYAKIMKFDYKMINKIYKNMSPKNRTSYRKEITQIVNSYYK